MKFSIIIVTLNAGNKLQKTVESVQRQSYTDYEILIKDGGSADGSAEPYLKESQTREDLSETLPALRVYVQKDKSIYDAMNQAVKLARGEYFLFLNTGDYLYDENVLQRVAEAVEARQTGKQTGVPSGEPAESFGETAAIFYGNLYQRNLDTEVYSYKKITPFTCYRNIPCHQTCFYHRSLFAERAYDLAYPVRSDYEHFLYCFFTKKAGTVYLPIIIASYEGAGFSETKEHLKQAKKEHKEITARYFSKGKLFRYKVIMMLTLQPVRTYMANNKALSGIYNKIKTSIYKKDTLN